MKKMQVKQKNQQEVTEVANLVKIHEGELNSTGTLKEYGLQR